MKKRIMAFGAAAALLLMSAQISFAAENRKPEAAENTVEISLGKIETIMSAGGKYFEEAQSKKQKLLSTQKTLRRKIEKINGESDGSFESGAAASTYYDDLRNSKNEFELLAASAESDLQKQILTARQAYLKYFTLLGEDEILGRRLEREQQKNEIAKKKYERGLISQKEYTDGLNRAASLKEKKTDLAGTMKKQEAAIKDAMGLSRQTKLRLLPPEEMAAALTVRFPGEEERKRTALLAPEAVKIQLQIKQLNMEYLQNKPEIRDLERELKKTEETFLKDFSDQYAELQRAAEAVQRAGENLKNASSDYEKTKEKHERGLLSKGELETAAADFQEKEGAARDAELALSAEYLTYDFMRKQQ